MSYKAVPVAGDTNPPGAGPTGHVAAPRRRGKSIWMQETVLRRASVCLAVVFAAIVWFALLAETPRPRVGPGPAEPKEGVAVLTQRVLLTGFEPFLGFPSNPSGDVAMALNNTCMVVSVSPIADIATAACFDSVVLPVSSEGMAKAQALLDENACLGGSQDEARFTHPCERRWSTVIHLGLEDAAKGLKVEMAAANMRAQDGASASASSVDDDGSVGGWSDAFDHKPREGVTPISSDGPWLFPSTARLDCLSLPRLREISASEHVHHVKELWSRDAGTYFCNELYFRSLESARQSPAPHPSTVFVHLPDLSVASVSDLTILVREIAKEVVETRHMGAC